MACRHKTGNSSMHLLPACNDTLHDLMPPRDFGCTSPFLHPKVPFIATSNTFVRFYSSPAYQSSLFLWQQMTFPHPEVHVVLFTEKEIIFAPQSSFSFCFMGSVLACGDHSYFIKAFIPSLPQRACTVGKKCVLLRAECGLLEPTQAGSC